MKTEDKKIAVIGTGGVGGYVAGNVGEGLSSCDNGGPWSQRGEHP